MRPKTIILLILLAILIYAAAAPLGQIAVDIGGIFINVGHFLEGLKLSG